MILIHPLRIITQIPYLIWAITSNYYVVALIVLWTVLMIFIISLKKRISIKNRKLLFITTIHVLSFVLIYYEGLSSTLYLLRTCVLAFLFILLKINTHQSSLMQCFLVHT